MLPLRVEGKEAAAGNLHLFVPAVPRENKGPRGILGQRVLGLLHSAAMDVPLDKLQLPWSHTNTGKQKKEHMVKQGRLAQERPM